MKIKTSEATPSQIDYLVAKCEGLQWASWNRDGWSTNWAEGGPIIERERLGVWFSEAVHDENGKVLREACWYCETCCTTDNGDEPYRCEIGDTPLIAAMRCYVASKLGDEVDVPEELQGEPK